VLAAAVAALAATGCGRQQLDVDKVAQLTKSVVEEQLGEKVKAISCPDEVTVQAKGTFHCLVTGKDGTRGTAVVTQTDGKGTISVDAPFLSNEETERTILSDLRKRSPRATVVCPDIIVVRKRGTFRCTANRGEVNDIVSATLTSASGSFTYDVKPRE
jgi:hypothetical protein